MKRIRTPVGGYSEFEEDFINLSKDAKATPLPDFRQPSVSLSYQLCHP
jgi:hypothetical protein